MKPVATRRRQQKRKLSRSASPRGAGGSSGGVLGSLAALAGYRAVPAGHATQQPSGHSTGGAGGTVSAGIGTSSAPARDTASGAKRKARKRRRGREEGPAAGDIKNTFVEWVPASGGAKTPTAAPGDGGEKKTVTVTMEPGSGAKLSRYAKQRQRKKMKRMQQSQSESGGSGTAQNVMPTTMDPKPVTGTPVQTSAVSNGDQVAERAVPNGSTAEASSRNQKRTKRAFRRQKKRTEKRLERDSERRPLSGAGKPPDDAVVKVGHGKNDSGSGEVKIVAEVPPRSSESKKELVKVSPSQQKQSSVTATGAEDTRNHPAPTFSASNPAPATESRPMSYSAKRRAKKRQRAQSGSAAESQSVADGKVPEGKITDPGEMPSAASTDAAGAGVSSHADSSGPKRRGNRYRKRQRLASKADGTPASGDSGEWHVLDSVSCEPESETGGNDGKQTQLPRESKPQPGISAAADSNGSAGAGAGAVPVAVPVLVPVAVRCRCWCQWRCRCWCQWRCRCGAGASGGAGAGAGASGGAGAGARSGASASGGADGYAGTSYSARRRAKRRQKRIDSLANSESANPPTAKPQDVNEKTTKPAPNLSADTASKKPDAESCPNPEATAAQSVDVKRVKWPNAKRNRRRKNGKAAGGVDPSAAANGTQHHSNSAAGSEVKSADKSSGTEGPMTDADKPTTGSEGKSTDKPSQQPSLETSQEPTVPVIQMNSDDDDDSEKPRDRRWWWKGSESSGKSPEGDKELRGEGDTGEKPASARAKRRQRKRRVKDRLTETAPEPTTASTTGADSMPPPVKVPKLVSSSDGAASQSQPEATSETNPQRPVAAETGPSSGDRQAIRRAKRAERLRQLRQRRRKTQKELRAAGARAAAAAAVETRAEPATAADTKADGDSTDKVDAESTAKCDTAESEVLPLDGILGSPTTIFAAAAAQPTDTTFTAGVTVQSSTESASAAAKSTAPTAASVKATTTTAPVSTETSAGVEGAESAAVAPAGSKRRQRRKRGHGVARPGRLLMGGTVTDPLNLASLESPDEPR